MHQTLNFFPQHTSLRTPPGHSEARVANSERLEKLVPRVPSDGSMCLHMEHMASYASRPYIFFIIVAGKIAKIRTFKITSRL